MKTCRGCKTELPVSAFHASVRSSDGLQARCSECQNQYRRLRVAANRERVRAALPVDHAVLKRCPQCQQSKARTEFHNNRSTRDGLQTYCKPCSADTQRNYVRRNDEAIAAKQAERLLRGAESNAAKTCTKCGSTKPAQAFYMHRGTKDGRGTHCIDCQKARTRQWNKDNRAKIAARNAAYRIAQGGNLPRDQRHLWLSKYGLTPETYDLMLAGQEGVCAICRLPERSVDARTGKPRRLCVDHCHTTGRVRGLLCGHCNRAIGQLFDDPIRMSRAAEYLAAVVE